MEKFNQLKALIESAQMDAAAFFEKGNKAAGTRLRNVLQQSKVIAQDVRQEITSIKKVK